MDKQKTVSPPSPYQLDTPLNNLIRECFGLWSEQSSAYGIHFNSVSGQYGGEFYEFVKALFEHYFPKSAYQSDQALGKRIKRVMNARRGKDIG
ncbi:hypothetical protein [Paramylibacter ulvae]|nr:hypothetical protein [Amylibacter ulvae]